MFPSTFRAARRAIFAVVVFAPLALCFACGSDEVIAGSEDPQGFPSLQEQHPPNCGGFEARMRACGLLSPGPFACNEPITEADRCEFECVTASSCPILWDLHCGDIPGVLQSCLSLCRTFVCEDGAGIPDTWECDGEADCLDLSDEVACNTFECASGEVLVARARCNRSADCIDASDERDCPGFSCANGVRIPEFWQCDGEFDCADRSDEAGCPTFECATTGSTLPASSRCDQVHDCLDSSDEVGCAALLCR